MSTATYTRNEVKAILNGGLTPREMLNELLGMPSDVVEADRPYWLAARTRVEEIIDIVEARV